LTCPAIVVAKISDLLGQPRDLLPSKRFGLYHEVVDVPIRAKNYRLKCIKFREQNRSFQFVEIGSNVGTINLLVLLLLDWLPCGVNLYQPNNILQFFVNGCMAILDI